MHAHAQLYFIQSISFHNTVKYELQKIMQHMKKIIFLP